MARFTKANVAVAIVIVLAVAGVAGVLAWSAVLQSGSFASPPSNHPSDDEMIRDFLEHRQQFAELLRMLQADPGLEGVDDLYQPDNLEDWGVTETARQYAGLLEQLGIEHVQPGENNGLVFRMSTYGHAAPRWVTGYRSWVAGYVYSIEPPAPLVVDIEAEPLEGYGWAYRHLEDRWYLLYEWDN